MTGGSPTLARVRESQGPAATNQITGDSIDECACASDANTAVSAESRCAAWTSCRTASIVAMTIVLMSSRNSCVTVSPALLGIGTIVRRWPRCWCGDQTCSPPPRYPYAVCHCGCGCSRNRRVLSVTRASGGGVFAVVDDVPFLVRGEHPNLARSARPSCKEARLG